MAQNMDVKEVLKEYFEEADIENKGYLTVSQTKAVLEKALEFALEDRLTTRIIELCDVDNSGNINFDEFCTSAKALVEALMQLASEFHLMDQDGSGNLGRQEVTRMLNMGSGGGLHKDDKLIDAIFIETDRDGDGRISFHEFLYFMSGQILRQDDKNTKRK